MAVIYKQVLERLPKKAKVKLVFSANNGLAILIAKASTVIAKERMIGDATIHSLLPRIPASFS